MWSSNTNRSRVAFRVAGACSLVAAMLFGACAGSEAGTSAPQRNVTIELTDAGCNPSDLELAAGRVKFYVYNPHSSRVTSLEISLRGSRLLSIQNVLGGLTRSQAVDLSEGTYTMRCVTGSAGGEGTLRVTN